MPENIANSRTENSIDSKIEKLITAVYMVSNFISEKEDIKYTLRNSVITLLNVLKKEEYREALTLALNIKAILNVCKNGNLISEMNADILIEAFSNLENILEKKATEEKNKENKNVALVSDFGFVLNREDLEIVSLESGNPKEEVKKVEVKNTVLKDNPIRQITESKILNTIPEQNANSIKKVEDKNISIRQDRKEVVRESVRENLKDKTFKKQPISKSVLVQERKENRREQIVNLFSKGVELSIKDISKKIPGCSGKTVARELENLIVENVLKMRGERRWARYMLS